MKQIGLVAFAVLAASSNPAARALQWQGPQAEAPETKDRLSPEVMDELVKGPMATLKSAGLPKAQQAFEALVAAAVKKHGKGSVEEADLLTSFGVALNGADSGDHKLERVALTYIERSIAAYRAAFGPRHPEVAVALHSYWTLAHNLRDKALEPTAEAALEEALSIRTEKFGPDNPETKATAAQFEWLRDPQNRQMDDALAAAGEALNAAVSVNATAKIDVEASTAVQPDKGRALWRPEYHYNPLVDEFVDGLQQLDPKAGEARRAFAAKYGLSVAALNEAVALLHAVAEGWFEDSRKAPLRAKALAWFQHTDRAPAALALTGGILKQVSDTTCTTADVELLMKGSRNPEEDSWILATTCGDSGSTASLIDRSGKSRAALLYLASTTTGGDGPSNLAAYDMLLRPEFLAEVDQGQRDRVHAELAHDKLSQLISLGLLNQAVAFGDTLDPAIRKLALKPEKGEIRTTIGGFVFKDNVSTDSVGEDYAAALALAGRKADARAVLDLVEPRAKLKEVRACLDAAKPQCDFGYDGVPLGALIVDQLLDGPSADPYILLEAATRDTSNRYSGVTEALCRLLTRPDEAKDCADARRLATPEPQALDKDDIALWAAIRRAGGPAFEATRARYAAMLPPPAGKATTPDWSRASVDPASAPFPEHSIAANLLSKTSQAAGGRPMASLPKGFELIRSERSGKRVVAISLSTRFDPNGEVSGGGYWVHFSEDGGKSWAPPLYTGLAEHFPYIVSDKSRLPLIAGDHLHLEVQESLIDTASITYPPVGLHIRHKRSGIYLDIPIADLSRDSDGDGLTDIAAHHLLLDTKSSAPTPFVVGRDRDCAAASPETQARLAIVKELFQVEARALIEPPDKKAIFGDWRRIQPSGKPPIFFNGNPDDWRCVTVDRPMIVYSDADRERLRKFSPDFQLISLPAIHWNRDHTRGFVQWSMGWTGGTYRITRKGDGWKLESIGSWIT